MKPSNEHSVTAFLLNRHSVIWTFLSSLHTKADSECLCVIWFHIPGTNLQLFICEIFPQFFGDTFEVFERDFASFIVIKEFESFENLLFGIFFSLKEVSISLRKKSSGYVAGNTQSYKRQALERPRNSLKSKFKEVYVQNLKVDRDTLMLPEPRGFREVFFFHS